MGTAVGHCLLRITLHHPCVLNQALGGSALNCITFGKM